MAKYMIIAYVLWLFLGWAGVHHFYLRRTRQGVLWLTSCSGFFGVGWLRDFWRIPTYVSDANDDQVFLALMHVKLRNSNRPSFFKNLHRIVGQVLFAMFYRGLIYCAIPWDSSYLMDYAGLIIPLGTAFGIYMVANVGWQKSSPVVALFSAYLGELMYGVPCHLLQQDEEPSSSLVAVFATITNILVPLLLRRLPGWEWRREWIPKYESRNETEDKVSSGENEVEESGRVHSRHRQSQSNTSVSALVNDKIKTHRNHISRKKTFLVVVVVWCVFVFLLGSFFYFNATVETEDGETIKIRDAMDNFFNSPAWKQIKSAFWVLLTDLYRSWRTGGYKRAWEKFVDLADVEGEDHAYDVLGLERGAEFKEVRQRYKELAKEWHPDHHQGERKKEAQEKFVEYNKAYKVLEDIYKRRKKYGNNAD